MMRVVKAAEPHEPLRADTVTNAGRGRHEVAFSGVSNEYVSVPIAWDTHPHGGMHALLSTGIRERRGGRMQCSHVPLTCRSGGGVSR